MEGDEQQRRQYEQPNYPRGFVSDLRGTSGTNLPEALDHRAAPGENVPERFRQSQLLATRTPTTASMNPVGGNSQDLSSYNYTPGQQYAAPQMQGTSMQYAADYPHDTQRQQHFPHYASQMMYNVSPQPQHQSPYDSVPQYQPRQTAAIEVLSTQFGVPQYYNAGETTSAPEPPAMVQQYTPTQFHPPLLYHPSASIAQPTLASSFTPGMADLAPPEAAAAPTPEEGETQDQDSGAFDRAYAQYQEALKQTFENTRDGRLVEAGQSLLEISDWLLGAASELGLLHDDETLHGQRIQLWDEFNTCWLAVLQRQKESTQAMLDAGQSPPPPQSLIPEEFLEKMGHDLVRLCDAMERHGLVDYQMGVWEEEIISILTQCLDLLEPDDEEVPEAGTRVEPGLSAHGSSRRTVFSSRLVLGRSRTIPAKT